MRNLVRWTLAMALVAVAPLKAEDGPAVTIHNGTGVDLTVRRPSGGAACAMLIQAVSDAHPETFHRLCCAYPLRSPEAECPVDYLFKEGDTATFRFEETGKDLASDLVFWRQDGDFGLTFKGTVRYSVVHRPGPDGTPQAVGQLSLPKGPTPRTRDLPQNRNILVHSPSELTLR